MKTANKLTIAIIRISLSIITGRSPALLADEDEENLGAVSEIRRLSKLS